MAGTTLDLGGLLDVDRIGAEISNTWTKWDQARRTKKQEWLEVRNFIFATDTSTTSNSDLPWKNKTVTPKLTQIRDNLYANYLATIFPKRRWLKWEGASKLDEAPEKKNMIENYMFWITGHSRFKKEIDKLILDYIDYGNVFVEPVWADERIQRKNSSEKVGFVGPVPKRISPEDIVFNPLAANFQDSPKIIRSFVSVGDLKKMVTSVSQNSEEGRVAQEAFKYLVELRETVRNYSGSDISDKNIPFQMDGFQDYQTYLSSNMVELLTFRGDLYDIDNDVFYENYRFVVADRHKVLWKEPDESIFGRAPVFHVGWRHRQDNLWAMGPLDNLVGLQYRIDHVENLKADCFDLITFPVLKIKGHVNDFEWGPFEKIFVGDEGDVTPIVPDVNVLNNNIEIQELMGKMEELAGAPKEAMGFRTPGEKTMYEVQRLENAASRIFQNKSAQFEEYLLEPLLNAMLEMARRYGDSTIIRNVEPTFGATLFTEVTSDDLSGVGAIRPVAARHFAESAEIVQNLSNFFNSAVGQDEDVKMHFSSIKVAKMMEEVLEIQDWNLVEENVRIAERADASRLQNQSNEDLFAESQTDPGVTPMGPSGAAEIERMAMKQANGQ